MLCLFAFSLLNAQEEIFSHESIESAIITQSSSIQSPVIAQPPLSFDEIQPLTPLFKQKKSVFWSVGLSTLFPGLGHVYLDDPVTAAGLFGSSSVGLTVALSSHSKNAVMTSVIGVQNIYFYGIYAAYRDVRNWNGQTNYRYKMPTDSLNDLTTAPFNLSVLKKPEVWGGFLGAMGLASAISFLMPAHLHLSSSNMHLSPLNAFPVAIGEETFFRGYLQSNLSEYSPPWVSIALSSLLFGAAHLGNAQGLDSESKGNYYSMCIPFISAFGAYLGWMTHKYRSLKESVALHCWYDFTLFACTALAKSTPKAATGRPSIFAISIPF